MELWTKVYQASTADIQNIYFLFLIWLLIGLLKFLFGPLCSFHVWNFTQFPVRPIRAEFFSGGLIRVSLGILSGLAGELLCCGQ